MLETELLEAALAVMADVMAVEAVTFDRESAAETAAILRRRVRAAAWQVPSQDDAAIRALLMASPHPAAQALLAAQSLIPWDTNPVGDVVPEELKVYTVSTLMGPEGPIYAPNLRCGLYYQRPGSYYPLHDHDADETYVILAGDTMWTAGEDTREREIGEMIHHPSHMPHAFATNGGMLAMWRWWGDVNLESYRFLPDPALASV
jgi:quercetin dioxygenase-like cupin family protein